MTRISTVIAGLGATIVDTETHLATTARPFVTTRLSGDKLYEGKLTNGPIRFFNVIFDPNKVDVAVTIMKLEKLSKEIEPPTMPTYIFCADGAAHIVANIALAIGVHDTAVDPSDGSTLRSEIGATLMLVKCNSKVLK